MLDAQLLSGDGVGEDLLGLLNSGSGLTVTARSTATRQDALLAAAAKVRGYSYTGPIVVALNAADLLLLTTDKASGLYTFKPELYVPFGVEGFVSSGLIPAGTAMVGSFAEAVMLYVRQGIAIALGESHLDYFTRGLVALIAETRVTSRVVRPNALQLISGFSGA